MSGGTSGGGSTDIVICDDTESIVARIKVELPINATIAGKRPGIVRVIGLGYAKHGRRSGERIGNAGNYRSAIYEQLKVGHSLGPAIIVDDCFDDIDVARPCWACWGGGAGRFGDLVIVHRHLSNAR